MKHWLYMALLVVLFVAPLLALVVYALAPGWRFPDLWPHAWSMRTIEQVFMGPQTSRIFSHLLWSVVYSLLTTGATLAICLVPAQHLARHEFSGKRVLEALLLAPALVPAMTFSMGVHFAFIKLGLADTLPGVVLVLTVFSYPYMLRALVAGYQAFGREYELCAANLGAGFFQRLLSVELPLILPSAIAGGSVVFLVAFSEYFLVFLIGGGAVPSYTGYLFPILNSSDRALGSMLTLVFLLVPLLLFVLTDVVVTRAYRKRGMY